MRISDLRNGDLEWGKKKNLHVIRRTMTEDLLQKPSFFKSHSTTDSSSFVYQLCCNNFLLWISMRRRFIPLICSHILMCPLCSDRSASTFMLILHHHQLPKLSQVSAKPSTSPQPRCIATLHSGNLSSVFTVGFLMNVTLVVVIPRV